MVNLDVYWFNGQKFELFFYLMTVNVTVDGEMSSCQLTADSNMFLYWRLTIEF